jgi:hypothetical protein
MGQSPERTISQSGEQPISTVLRETFVGFFIFASQLMGGFENLVKTFINKGANLIDTPRKIHCRRSGISHQVDGAIPLSYRPTLVLSLNESKGNTICTGNTQSGRTSHRQAPDSLSQFSRARTGEFFFAQWKHGLVEQHEIICCVIPNNWTDFTCRVVLCEIHCHEFCSSALRQSYEQMFSGVTLVHS